MTPRDDQQRLDDFYSVLREKLQHYRDAKQHLDRFLSTDFNVFKWITPKEKIEPKERHRYEIILSKIIADLLNPSGSHGQNRRFLDAFLEIIKRPDLKDKKRPKVDREAPTDRSSENPRGKIDILVEFENFGLGIENKLDADEQKKQLQGYYEHLKEKYGDQGFCLVFITPDGREPKSIEPSKPVCVSYNPDMLNWIKKCCQLCESDKFRWFLRDFMDYIPTILQEGPMDDSIERNLIFNHALENEKNLEIVLKINSAFDDKLELHRRIIVQFLDKLEKFVLEKLRQRPDGSEWEVNYDSLRDSPLNKNQYKTFGFGKQSWGRQYTVAIEPQSHCAGDVTIGVGWEQKDTLRADQVEHIWKSLEPMFKTNDGEPTESWVWRGLLREPYTNWNTKEALIKLYNGEAVKDLGKDFVNIIDVVEQIIDKHVQKS